MDFEQLPGNWKWSTILGLAAPNTKAIVSGPFGSNIGSRFFVESGVPVIRGNNLTQDLRKFVDDGFVFVTPEKATKLGNVEAVEDDLIFTAAGTIGQVGIIPKNSNFKKYIISNKQLRARLDQKKIIPIFAFYWFSSPNMVEYIQQQNTGSTIPLINLSVLKKLPIPVPNSLDEQLEIINILSSLDNKIELNQRMNDTLEGIAQALFKSWFVDFDPVQAKLEGRLPLGMDEETALLFPDSFEVSALGKMPMGWKIGRVSDVSEVTDFVANGSFESLRNNVKYTSDPDYAILVRLVDFNHGWKGNYVYLSETAYNFLKKSALEPDDVVIANVGANAGTVFKVPNLGKPTTLGPNAVVVKPLEAIGMSKQYVYYLFSSPEGQQQLQSILSGSAQPKFNKTDMRALRIAIPSHEVLNLFKQLTKALWERQRVIHSETETLTKIRDTLLPRLISGKLHVCEISEVVEAVAS